MESVTKHNEQGSSPTAWFSAKIERFEFISFTTQLSQSNFFFQNIVVAVPMLLTQILIRLILVGASTIHWTTLIGIGFQIQAWNKFRIVQWFSTGKLPGYVLFNDSDLFHLPISADCFYILVTCWARKRRVRNNIVLSITISRSIGLILGRNVCDTDVLLATFAAVFRLLSHPQWPNLSHFSMVVILLKSIKIVSCLANNVCARLSFAVFLNNHGFTRSWIVILFLLGDQPSFCFPSYIDMSLQQATEGTDHGSKFNNYGYGGSKNVHEIVYGRRPISYPSICTNSFGRIRAAFIAFVYLSKRSFHAGIEIHVCRWTRFVKLT